MIRVDLERRRRRVANIFTLAVLAVWIVVGIVEPPYLLPGPGDVLERLGAFVIDPHMWVHAGASLLHVIVAVAGVSLPPFFFQESGSTNSCSASSICAARPFRSRG